MSRILKTGTRPIGIDLFAGAGGLSLGFEQAGFDIEASVEIDPIHCATHEFNFPNSKAICASVVDMTGAEIRRRAGLADLGSADIDVVFGGAPCQGFSMMGKRALDDQRNQLVFHYVRLVGELRPKYCVFENVKGLTLGKQVQFLDELIVALGVAGYKVLLPYRVLNASDFGVPQDRRRLFLIGAREDQAMPSYPHNPLRRRRLFGMPLATCRMPTSLRSLWHQIRLRPHGPANLFTPNECGAKHATRRTLDTAAVSTPIP